MKQYSRRVFFLSVLFVFFSCQESNKTIESISKEYAVCDMRRNIPANYTHLCQCVKEHNLTFPHTSVVSGKIYHNARLDGNGFRKGEEYPLDAVFLQRFRTIITDTSNFDWGEIGTAYTDYVIEFYNADGHIVNTAIISYDGMLWVSPEFAPTKWGLLSLKGENTLKELMNHYTDQSKH